MGQRQKMIKGKTTRVVKKMSDTTRVVNKMPHMMMVVKKMSDMMMKKKNKRLTRC
jgi:hypothetical protein